jgi:hypothetical protein
MKNLYLLAVTSILLFPFTSLAQWQPTTGPLGAGHISAMEISGPNILAGTITGGVYYSPDSGTTWTPSAGITNPYDVKAMAVDGANSFVGYYTSLGDTAVFLSTDNGVSWSGTNISGIFLFSLAAKPGPDGGHMVRC